MKRIIAFAIAACMISVNACGPATSHTLAPHGDQAWNRLFDNLEFDMPVIQPPAFPTYRVSIVDYGAVPDGTTLNTEAINKAIAEVSANAGGTVIIPRGIWLSGPVVLQSHVNLHLEQGALLLFSDDFDQYPLIKTSFEGLETYRCQSPISGRNLENIAITGQGIIDGNGDAWRPVKIAKMTDVQWKNLIASGGVLNEEKDMWYPSEAALRGAEKSEMNVPDLNTREDYEAVRDYLRPVMVSLVQCKNVLLDGPTFQNSPAWNIHPLMCENVIVRNLYVKNPWYSQNGDGLDIESCKNTIVYNCRFDVGDDAICIKSGKNEDGRKRGMPTENLVVKNNVVYHGHGGFVVGSEMSGGVRNVHVSQCTFMGTDTGLRFKSARGRGGIVENIYISDISMMNIPTEAIRFNMYYAGQSPIPEQDGSQPRTAREQKTVFEVSEETPQFRNIHIKDIVCRGAGQAVALQGLPEMNLENVVIEQIDISADKGILAADVLGATLRNVHLQTKAGPVLHFQNSKNVTIDGLTYISDAEHIVRVNGAETKNVVLKNTALLPGQLEATDIAPSELKFEAQ
jgi:polygalacturonase